MRQKQPWCYPNTWWAALLNMKPVHLQITSPFMNWAPFWRDLDNLVCLVSVTDGKKKRWRLQSDLGVSRLFHKSGGPVCSPAVQGAPSLMEQTLGLWIYHPDVKDPWGQRAWGLLLHGGLGGATMSHYDTCSCTVTGSVHFISRKMLDSSGDYKEEQGKWSEVWKIIPMS